MKKCLILIDLFRVGIHLLNLLCHRVLPLVVVRLACNLEMLYQEFKVLATGSHGLSWRSRLDFMILGKAASDL